MRQGGSAPGGEVGGPPGLVEVVSQAIDNHGEGEAFHFQPPYGFRAQILIAHQLGGLDALGQQGPCAADSAEVDRSDRKSVV